MGLSMMIIGAGAIAGMNEFDVGRRKPCSHAGVARAHPGLSIAGVVDVDCTRAKYFAEMFDLGYWSTSLTHSLGLLRPDVVTIAVPYRHQHDVALKVMAHEARPRILVLEKPLAASLAEAEAIVAAAKRCGVSLLVNNDCASPVYRQIERLIENTFALPALSVSGWSSSGMHAVGIHMLGILRRLFGPISDVTASEETEPVFSLPFSPNFEHGDRRVRAMIQFSNGMPGFFVNSALTSFTYKEIEVLFRDGKLRLSDNGGKLEVWRPAQHGVSSLSYRLAEPEIISVDQGTAFSVLGDLIVSAENPETQDLIGGGRGLEIYRVMDAMFRSADSHSTVSLEAVG